MSMNATMKITVDEDCDTSFDTDVKRFYVPGHYLEGNCPKCGAEYERDFESQYLSYPIANKPIDVGCYCDADGCGHQWDVTLRLNINVEVIDTTASIVGESIIEATQIT